MNLFWAAVRNVTAVRRFDSSRRFNPLPRPTKSTALFCKREVVFVATCLESFPLRELGHDVFLRMLAAPTALRPARLKKRGGRANRRRCARWRRFPSDCRVRPHSDMRNMVLCQNFSGEHSCLVRFEQGKWVPNSRRRNEGEATRAGKYDGRNEAA